EPCLGSGPNRGGGSTGRWSSPWGEEGAPNGEEELEGGDEEVKRVTKGTDVHVKINLDGTGVANSSTGIPFLDHMLDQLASHGLFDVYVKATGDTHIDDHHSNEDIALAIGTALLQALGDRKGINRFAHFTAPLDEAAVEVILAKVLTITRIRLLAYARVSVPTLSCGTHDLTRTIQKSTLHIHLLVTANARDAPDTADTIEIEPAFAPARSSSPRYEL
ncbi:hypothetical protein ZWY2020_037535, partial [Hordeum vulgare]